LQYWFAGLCLYGGEYFITKVLYPAGITAYGYKYSSGLDNAMHHVADRAVNFWDKSTKTAPIIYLDYTSEFYDDNGRDSISLPAGKEAIFKVYYKTAKIKCRYNREFANTEELTTYITENLTATPETDGLALAYTITNIQADYTFDLTLTVDEPFDNVRDYFTLRNDATESLLMYEFFAERLRRFDTPGTYTIKYRATDYTGLTSDWITSEIVVLPEALELTMVSNVKGRYGYGSELDGSKLYEIIEPEYVSSSDTRSGIYHTEVQLNDSLNPTGTILIDALGNEMTLTYDSNCYEYVSDYYHPENGSLAMGSTGVMSFPLAIVDVPKKVRIGLIADSMNDLSIYVDDVLIDPSAITEDTTASYLDPTSTQTGERELSFECSACATLKLVANGTSGEVLFRYLTLDIIGDLNSSGLDLFDSTDNIKSDSYINFYAEEGYVFDSVASGDLYNGYIFQNISKIPVLSSNMKIYCKSLENNFSSIYPQNLDQLLQHVNINHNSDGLISSEDVGFSLTWADPTGNPDAAESDKLMVIEFTNINGGFIQFDTKNTANYSMKIVGVDYEGGAVQFDEDYASKW
jgi:hypothetical protein